MRDRAGSLLAQTGRPWEQSRWLLTGEALAGAHTEARVFAPDAGFLPRARRRLSSRCGIMGTSRVVTAPAGKLRALLWGGCPAEEEDRGLHAACASQGCVHLTWQRDGQLFSPC